MEDVTVDEFQKLESEYYALKGKIPFRVEALVHHEIQELKQKARVLKENVENALAVKHLNRTELHSLIEKINELMAGLEKTE